MSEPALQLGHPDCGDESCSRDYVLSDGIDSVWITVQNVSVNLLRDGLGLTIAACPHGLEMDSDLNVSCRILFEDALQEKEKYDAARKDAALRRDAKPGCQS